MGTNWQVFSSNAERTNYYKLCRQWGNCYRIYHNLPFLNVFNKKGLLIQDIDFNRLKKTSIDYTLCDENDRPLICIDFDGLQDGFNVGSDYKCEGPSDPWRELIMGLKLRVAHGSLFPYFVVGYEHFKDLSDSVQLTIVDGIIGEVLSNLATDEKFQEGFRPDEKGYTQEEFEELGPWEQQEIVQDWVIGVEVDSEMAHNPVSRKLCELWRTLDFLHYSSTYLTFPSADQATSLVERCRMLDQAVLNGCRCTVEPPKLCVSCEPVTATVWLPNFKTPGCLSVLGLAETIAEFVALDKARMRFARQ